MCTARMLATVHNEVVPPGTWTKSLGEFCRQYIELKLVKFFWVIRAARSILNHREELLPFPGKAGSHPLNVSW